MVEPDHANINLVVVKNLKVLLAILLITAVPTLLLWAPFILRFESIWGIPLPDDGMARVVANYDGPLYIVVSKTFYNRQEILQNYSFPLPAQYYAAHFPLYPALIRLFSPIFGSLYSMLIVTLLSSTLAGYYFYLLIKEFVGKNNALFATLVFSVIPARWLVSHSVGSADPLFIAGIIASIYHFRRQEYLKSGLWGAVAQLTKSPGILLFAAYVAYILTNKIRVIINHSFSAWVKTFEIKKTYPILLIPAALIGVFFIYFKTTGNFLAYFNSGDNIHLMFPPFGIFNFSQPWVGTFWLEENIYIYLIGAMGVYTLARKKEKLLAWFAGIFFTSLLFVTHRDLMRYALPLMPFIYVAFSDLFKKNEFKFAFLVILIPIYLFSLVFISQNVMPISDWRPFL